ncbi:putative quinol monooxygenase [Microbacterium rhizophilus]|uniref:putative quinol monooxygenase n=1 Tax=Microbacterium rhizophilus TaxID=3138934 RepID=UPI0031ED755A
MTGGVQLVARFTALPGREEEVERLLLALAANVRAEPGCLVFDPFRVGHAPPASGARGEGPASGTGFLVVESYRDEDAFAAHLAAAYGAEFNTALAALIVEDGSELTFVTPLG